MYCDKKIPLHLSPQDICIINNNNFEMCAKEDRISHELYCTTKEERNILFNHNQCINSEGHPNLASDGRLYCNDSSIESTLNLIENRSCKDAIEITRTYHSNIFNTFLQKEYQSATDITIKSRLLNWLNFGCDI